MKEIDWHDCYSESWKGILSPEAFSHPAKFAYKLLSRLYDHGFSQGYWKKGDLIGDPFGGVACGGVVAAYKGLCWFGVELEPRFVTLAQQSIDDHRRRWEAMGDPLPQIVQGDSRRFAELVQAAAIVTSPPYAANEKSDYLLSDDGKTRARDEKRGYKQGHGSFRGSETYGNTEGQIGRLRMKEGELDGVLTSPPYAGLRQDGGRIGKEGTGGFSSYTDGCTDKWHTQRDPANIGNLGDEANVQRETYWQAVATVYQQCYLAIRSGGHLCCVVKDYVKNRTRVSLCDQTMRLLESIGFQPVERIRCWLVKEMKEAGLFGEMTSKKERKSFFRRLAESKGSPRIDWEEILIVRRPLEEKA